MSTTGAAISLILRMLNVLQLNWEPTDKQSNKTAVQAYTPD
jgi:hypothetical protein